MAQMEQQLVIALGYLAHKNKTNSACKMLRILLNLEFGATLSKHSLFRKNKCTKTKKIGESTKSRLIDNVSKE
jgi:hypothetical protein